MRYVEAIGETAGNNVKLDAGLGARYSGSCEVLEGLIWLLFSGDEVCWFMFTAIPLSGST